MNAPLATVASPAEAPVFKRFGSPSGEHLLIVPFSRIFDLPADVAARFDAGETDLIHLADALAATGEGEESLDLVPEVSPQSLSLNVSSACNLACTYCYADRGAFSGAQARPMNGDIARAAVDRLFAVADPARPVTIGFLGGEPFVNRALIHDVVAYAEARAAKLGLDVRFSVTTNATLLQPDDIALLRARPFAVTVSIDGAAPVHDAQRPLHNGRSSFAAVRDSIGPLLADPGYARIAARATVSRKRLDLAAAFAAIRAIGFHEVGFAPLRSASADDAMRDEDWSRYLAALMALAQSELAGAVAGGPITLTNFAVAMKQLHHGASAPYPCGAGGGYFSVSTQGRWYACHRAIGADEYELGDNGGLDRDKRRHFLQRHHVHAQTDCRACWARYLCSGGCHQEASSRTPAACDFIRGWLEFCLTSYCELIERRPDYFPPIHAAIPEAHL